MRRPTLTTERLRLVPMTMDHLSLLVELDSDPEVLRFILGRARSEDEARDKWEPVCADTEADSVGLGFWVGFHLDTDAFLGWWNLAPDVPVPARPPRAEAGWRLARRHWRQGYATEGARVLLDYGFAVAQLTTVWAETMAVNQPSRSVMVKLGMHHVRTDHRIWQDPLPGAEQGEVVYVVSRSQWAQLLRPEA